LASKPKAVKLLKERGRLQQSIKPLKQMQKNSKLGDAEVELHADKATLQLTTFTLQVYSSVLAAYTAAIRAKTQALEVEADNKPKADVAIARGQEPSAALDDLKKLLAERQVAILAGAHIIVRVEKVGRVLCFVL
jgi:hypothetical protein